MSKVIAIDARKLGDFGIGTYVLNLITQLAQLDSDARYVLFVSQSGQNVLPDLPENFELALEESKPYSLRELFRVSRHLRRRRVDLFHSTHYVLPFSLPCPTVVTIHDIIHLLFPDFLPNRLAFYYAKGMIRRSLLRSDRVITVSENTRSDLLKTFGIGQDKIEVIHNGVEPCFFEEVDDEARAEVLAAHDLEPGYVLFVGNPKPHKNLDRVLRAFAKARPELQRPVPLVCVGARDGADFKARQRTRQLGLDEHVRFIAHVDQESLRALYGAASLFVYPTLYEGFGLPVVEAMASGTAVVTSNSSALREIASGYAHLVSPLDTDEIAKAITHCLNDAEHRISLETLGRRRASDFEWHVAARRTLEVYRDVLSEAP